MAKVGIGATIEVADKYAPRITEHFQAFLDRLPAEIATVRVLEQGAYELSSFAGSAIPEAIYETETQGEGNVESTVQPQQPEDGGEDGDDGRGQDDGDDGEGGVPDGATAGEDATA